MALAPYVPSYWQNAGAAAALNANADFSSYPTSPGFPTAWANWSGALASTPVQVPGLGVRTVSTGGVDRSGINAAAVPVSQGGWFIVDVICTLNTGALTGSGACISFQDGGGSELQAFLLPFTTTPDVNGVTNSPGVASTTYHWRVLAHATAVGIVQARVAVGRYSGFGSIAAGNTLDWSLAMLRLATTAEIAGGNQVQSLPVLPLMPGTTIEVTKAPMFSTKIRRTTSLRERRTSYSAYPLWQFEMSYDVLRQRPSNDELAGLFEHFCTVQGQYLPWLYLDDSDFSVLGQRFGTGDSATTVFQLSRAIRTWNEAVYAPFGVTIYVNGVLKTAGADYTIGSNGVITFTSAPAAAAALTWSGSFFYLCRYSEDQLSMKRFMSQMWQGGVKFTSIRP